MDKSRFELLAPAGDIERLQMAVDYGADAVYMGGLGFGLRAPAEKLGLDDIKYGVEYAHQRGKKIYFTFNVYARDRELEKMAKAVESAKKIGADALIAADVGVVSLIKRVCPDMEIHISTQANVTNSLTACTYADMGASRIVLARELTLDEILNISNSLKGKAEVECFVHGAMCMSYSGRCLLSARMTGRDANRGECAQPCRWKYYITEETRLGEYYPIETDERGTYILNSKDLCMIRHLPELDAAGIYSLKIEGRMKSAYYTAVTVSAYRKAIDAYLENPEEYAKKRDSFYDEVCKTSHREYYTGFFFKGQIGADGQNCASSSYIRGYTFIATVKEYDAARGMLKVEQRNHFKQGETLEILEPDGTVSEITAGEMYNADGEKIETAQHPMMTVYIKCSRPIAEKAIVRRAEAQ